MRYSSADSVVIVAIGLLLILLLLLGGLGFYYFTERQQEALGAGEKARATETQTRIQAEQARKDFARAAVARPLLRDQESSIVDGDAIRDAVASVLRAQEDAWNRGDIDAFVDHYWKSDELTFSSEGKTARGWNDTLDRHRERYPTRDKMGRLSLGGLEIVPLSNSAALVLGEWSLDRESEPLSGNFSLVLRKFDGRWLIVHDHTSRLME